MERYQVIDSEFGTGADDEDIFVVMIKDTESEHPSDVVESHDGILSLAEKVLSDTGLEADDREVTFEGTEGFWLVIFSDLFNKEMV